MNGRVSQVWPVIALCAFCVVWETQYRQVHGLGVNWGTEASHPLPPATVVQMLKANNIQRVKLFDANSSVMNALANSGIKVTVAIPNDLLLSMTDPAQAQTWVQNNVERYLYSGGTSIEYVAVGNEPFLTTYNGTYTNTTYPALVNVQKALDQANLGEQVKATVPLNLDILSTSSVPSGTQFRSGIADTMIQIVEWLSSSNAPFMVNIYPFISLYNDKNFPVDYAFFDGTTSPVVDGQYTYQNVFDASFDSLVAALTAAGYGSMNIIVGEIGWPTDGDVNANPNYAKKFNQGFLNHIVSNVGTPRRPNVAIPFYLFSLIDEDEKSIAPGNFERHWGIFQYDGTPKYAISLTGANGQNLVQASGVVYMTEQWCVLNPNAGDMSSLPNSITYACTYSDCTSLGLGCSCYPELDANGNASYAFNQYFQRQNQGLGTCDFDGLAQITTTNPSKNTCDFIVQIAYTSDSAATYNTWKWPSALLLAVVALSHFFLYLE